MTSTPGICHQPVQAELCCSHAEPPWKPPAVLAGTLPAVESVLWDGCVHTVLHLLREAAASAPR